MLVLKPVVMVISVVIVELLINLNISGLDFVIFIQLYWELDGSHEAFRYNCNKSQFWVSVCYIAKPKL